MMPRTPEEIEACFSEYLGQSLTPNLAGQVSACCPFHNDRSPSLSLNMKTGLWKCHAGCGGGTIDKFEEMCLDLQNKEPAKALETVAGGLIPPIVTIYPYLDQNGHELYQVVRSDRAGKKNLTVRRMTESGGWTYELGGVAPVIYRLPEVMTADLVFVVEGEKCADALRALDLGKVIGQSVAVTCNPFGAGKWKPDFNAHFKGKRAIVLPDNDDKGLEHATNVAHNISPVATEVKLVKLPGLEKGGDIVDFIATLQSEAAEGLLRLVTEAPQFPKESRQQDNEAHFLTIEELYATTNEHVEWLIEGLLCEGGSSVIAARPKSGKSTLSRQLALAVARGESFLGRKTKQGRVLIVSLEDSPQIVVEHFKLLGVRAEDGVKVITTLPSKAILQKELCAHQTALIIIDPLFRFFKHVKSADDYMQVLRAFGELLPLFADYRTHVCAVHHLGKSEREDVFDGILGSTYVSAAVETLIAIKRKGSERTISTLQRVGFPLEETVLSFDPVQRRSELASSLALIEAQAKAEKDTDLHLSIISFLTNNPEATQEQIGANVKGKRALVLEHLKSMVERGSVTKTGLGGKGQPFKYSYVEIPIEGACAEQQAVVQ